MSLIGRTNFKSYSRLLWLEERLSDSRRSQYIEGRVYNHLQDLEEAGVIEPAGEQESGREAKIYEITANELLLLEALGER